MLQLRRFVNPSARPAHLPLLILHAASSGWFEEEESRSLPYAAPSGEGVQSVLVARDGLVAFRGFRATLVAYLELPRQPGP